jgi:hypothetical protein
MSLAVGLVVGLTGYVSAEDDAAAILAKAAKAHRGKAKKERSSAFETKSKGKLEIMGGLEITQTVKVQMPGKFKEVVELTVMNQKVTQTVVFNGKEGWLNVNGQDAKVDKLQEVLSEAAYTMEVSQLSGLKGKGFELSLIGEDKVNGKAAVGVRVAKKGHKDVILYFDKQTWLVAKVERRTYDFQSQQEVKEERIITEYKEVDGRPMPKKILVKRDDKKLMEAEITDVTFVDKFDDSEFAKP